MAILINVIEINEQSTGKEINRDGEFLVGMYEYLDTLKISYKTDEHTKFIIEKNILR